jgi:hypothetical protein
LAVSQSYTTPPGADPQSTRAGERLATLFRKMGTELLERVEDDRAASKPALRHARWPKSLVLTLQLLPAGTPQQQQQQQRAAAAAAADAAGPRTTSRSKPFPTAPASLDKLVRAATELKELAAGGAATAATTHAPLLVKCVTLTATFPASKPSPASPNINKYFFQPAPARAEGHGGAGLPASPSSRIPLPTPLLSNPSRHSPTSSPTSAGSASPREDDGDGASHPSPVASTCTADTHPLAGLAASPAVHSPAPEQLAGGSGWVQDTSLREGEEIATAQPPPAKRARVPITDPGGGLSLTAILRSLQSGELNSQEVSRPYTRGNPPAPRVLQSHHLCPWGVPTGPSLTTTTAVRGSGAFHVRQPGPSKIAASPSYAFMDTFFVLL